MTMTDREKLTALFEEANAKCARTKCPECEYDGDECWDKFLIDYLLANGVTFQQWIPVSERLPNTIPCGAGTEYSEAVNVLTSGRKVLTAIFDGTDFIADAEFWEAENEIITHWTPVLLPLPEPPKENTVKP